jgi:hypothetical protein
LEFKTSRRGKKGELGFVKKNYGIIEFTCSGTGTDKEGYSS